MGRRDYFRKEDKMKKITLSFCIALVLFFVIFLIIFNAYNNKLRRDAKKNLLELGSINAVVPNSTSSENTLSASTTSDRTINQVKNEIKKETNTIKSENKVIIEEVKKEEVIVENEAEVQPQKEINFLAPVSGEILKDFAEENLVYSKTLDEWTTHTGIDIKGEKTSIVIASEAGIVESIKNDPRYGLTITISHRDGYKSIYSNLLSTEFVQEGDSVEQGQTIGTIGESSSFEISDESHLHFEIMKDGVYVNPTIYLR